MRSIGFRAEKDLLHWAVVEGTPASFKLIADDKCPKPKTFDDADGLVLFRDRVQNLIAEYKVSAAAVRLSETYLKHKPKPNVLASMFARARIEGVVLEAARASGIPVHASQLVSISARLGSKSAKAYVTGGEFRGVDLSSKQPNRREAIVAAVSALKE